MRPWAYLVPLVTVLAVWLRPILAGRFWAGGDGLTELFPQRRIVAWALSQGEFPFWNPYIFGGMPLFAGIQPGVLSPFNWPAGFMGLAAGENATMGISYLVLVTGMLAFTRALGLAPAACAVAALAFPLGGFITTYVGGVAIYQAAGLTAWQLWAIERHAQDPRRRYLGALAAIACLTIFAGHPQTAAYGLLLAGAYVLVRGGGPKLLALRLAALVLGLGMAAVQLLPTLDLIHASQRRQIDYAWLTVASVSPRALPSLLFPALFGNATPTPLLPQPLWAPDEWRPALEAYVGPVTWFLALVAVWRRRERLVWFWAAIAAAGVVLSLGHHTPLYRLWALLPFVNQMPYASRHGFEESFALAVLAAYGLSAAIEAPEATRKALARAAGLVGGAMALVLAAVALFGRGFAARTQPFMDAAPGAIPGFKLAEALSLWQAAFWLPPLLLLLAWLAARHRPALAPWVLAVDLFIYNWHQGPFPQLPAAPTDLVLRPAIDWSAGRSLTSTVRRYPFVPGQDELVLIRQLHYPCITMLTGEPTVNGYDAFIPARYGAVFGMDSFGHAGETNEAIWEASHHALDLVGLSILRLEPGVAATPAWQRRLAGDRWHRLPDRDGLVVLANPRALPHAWRVETATATDAATADAALAGLRPFEPRREALVEGPLAAMRFAPGPASATSPSLNRQVLETDGPGPGLVVIASGYDPGWRAYSGTSELPLYRADAILTAVAVPAGVQHVELRYEPTRWRLGLGVSLGALALLLAGLLLPRRGRRDG